MLAPLQNIQDTPEDAARAVRDKALAEINQLNTKFVAHDAEWTSKIHSTNVYLTAAQKGLSNAQLYSLAITRQRWESLDLNFRVQYNNDFWFYACLMTGRQMQRLQELIGAIEVFVLEETKPLGTVPVPKRNEKGSVVPNEVEYRQFDPLEIDPGKLATLRSVAAKGQMTEKLWSMLVDEQISITEINLELMGGNGGGKGGGTDTSLKFYLEGPFLLAQEDGVTVMLGELDCWDTYYDDPHSLEHKAIKRLCAMLNLKLDEEVLRDKELRVRRTSGYYVENETKGQP